MSPSQIAAFTPTPSSSGAIASAARPEAAAPQARAVTSTGETAAVKPSSAELEKAVDTLNKFVQPMAHAINFSIDNTTGKTVIKVMDTENNTVLQQFPSEEALSMTRALDKLQGFLVKEKA